MEAKDLRIGNLVIPEYASPDKDLYVELTTKDIYYMDGGVYHFEPIPLTEDWLIKFGFEYRKKTYSLNTSSESFDYFFIEKYGFGLWKHNKGYSINELTKPTDFYIEYTHQLQNLFHALTGKELEINN